MGILTTRERWECAGNLGTVSKGQRKNVSFVATHQGLWRKKGVSELTGVIWGETGLGILGERAEGTAAKVPVLSPSPTPSFLGRALPSMPHQPGGMRRPHCLTPCGSDLQSSRPASELAGCGQPGSAVQSFLGGSQGDPSTLGRGWWVVGRDDRGL